MSKPSGVLFIVSSKSICIYVGKSLFFSQPITKSFRVPRHVSPTAYWYAYSYFLAMRFGLVTSFKEVRK